MLILKVEEGARERGLRILAILIVRTLLDTRSVEIIPLNVRVVI